MRTFSIQTLGCKVNHYESEQIASALRSLGWMEAATSVAEVRIVNTCSVTTEAASTSRQAARRAVKLPVLRSSSGSGSLPETPNNGCQTTPIENHSENPNAKVIVTGCWATSDRESALSLPGVDAVVTHHENVADRLHEILAGWNMASPPPSVGKTIGTRSLPLLGERQAQHQRAFLKIQDGCDAHCTYCIIPRLRPALWSKPLEDAIEEARRMVAAGHVELVLTGIFLGAYGHETALRRRQQTPSGNALADLIESLCTRVPGLLRLRLSSLEPGDLDGHLLKTLRSHEQIVPHFHLPLQSGSNEILRRMNRQYNRDDFLRLIENIQESFDRPALTTDIIVGFPGETDAEYQETLDIARRSKFIHIHAFPYSTRPGTAAARWKKDFVHGPVVGRRLDELTQLAGQFSEEFRLSFIGQNVQLLVEREESNRNTSGMRHGRCERYFDVHFESDAVGAGDLVEVRIDRVMPGRTFGTIQKIKKDFLPRVGSLGA